MRLLRNERRTMVFMDTPYRLLALLRDLANVFSNERQVCVAFNLTMADEQIFRGTAPQLQQMFENKNVKGEFVIVVEGGSRRK